LSGEFRAWVCLGGVPGLVGCAPPLGCFAIADLGGLHDTLYLETATIGQVVEVPSVVSEAALIFENLRSEALPRGASRDLIMKVAEQQWSD